MAAPVLVVVNWGLQDGRIDLVRGAGAYSDHLLIADVGPPRPALMYGPSGRLLSGYRDGLGESPTQGEISPPATNP